MDWGVFKTTGFWFFAGDSVMTNTKIKDIEASLFKMVDKSNIYLSTIGGEFCPP
jgi:hypothetical protein